MSVAYEIVDSMSGSVTLEQGESAVTEVRRRFVVGQFNNFNECYNFVRPYLPLYTNESPFSYWIRQSLNIQGIGNRYYDVTATYRTLGPLQDQGNEEQDQQPPEYTPGSVAWDTSGHTEHITQAIVYEAFPNTAADFEGAINVSGDSVQGLDVVRPAMRYSETWIMPVQTAMACGYISGIYKLTGTVNASKFRCFDPGECLFVGARGQWSDNSPYVAVTFEFEARPNDTDWTPWDTYSGAATTKKGWEHVWIRYEDDKDADTLIKKPIAAYKSQVYHEQDWGGLGIVPYQMTKPRDPIAPVIGRLVANGLEANGIPSGITV